MAAVKSLTEQEDVRCPCAICKRDREIKELQERLAEAEQERDWNAALVHELLPYQERAVAAETQLAEARAALEKES